jgi:hypothetical protein
MAITQAACTSFKKELFEGTHNFTCDNFKIALFTSSASLDASTTAYSATNEVSGTGYTAGGATLTPTVAQSGTTAYLDFVDVSWTSATISGIRGALIYNSTDSDKAVAVLDFGGDQAVTAGTFTIQWPVADASNAIIRIT